MLSSAALKSIDYVKLYKAAELCQSNSAMIDA